MTSHLPTTFVGLLSVLFVLVFYLASTDIPKTLSPQGCRMSWMSPSYILQAGFNTSWSPLAGRYSLWLYREVGWEGTPVNGVPILFIPGNAGSSHQVRSIASSAARQFYQSPYVVSDEFSGRKIKPLDFYAVEFNEDLSAFHGPTLDSQISYSSRAISYILSHYPPNTPIIVMGHSMGGIVATSLLPSSDISAIITMSTPHTLPPARFDARIDKIYAHNQQILLGDSTPILSLCGGATDMMIPSEFCILPSVPNNSTDKIFRRTVFTSALEGSWTGVGHREMVWCHQVRWRVARAALELGGSSSRKGRENILDRWLRDGNRLPSAAPASQHNLSLIDPVTHETLAPNIHLVLNRPKARRTYLLPFPTSPAKFVLYVSQGSIIPVSPQNSASLRVSVYLCYRQAASELSTVDDSQLHSVPPSCSILPPAVLKLIPNPIPGKSFPAPDEGTHESEGVVVFEADIQPSNSTDAWVAVHIEDADESGWVVGGFTSSQDKSTVITSDSGALAPFLGKVFIELPTYSQTSALQTEIQIPNLLSNALIAYRLTPRSHSTSSQLENACEDSLLPPILMHTSHPSESHYFPLVHSPPHALILHTHSSGPYVHSTRSRGLNLTLYTSSSPDCITGLDIQIDWWSTLGRLGSRYAMTVLSWSVGVVSLVLFGTWKVNRSDTSTVQQSLAIFISDKLPKVLVSSYIVACLPLPANYYLGTKGELLLAPIAPLIFFVATGLVCVSWWILVILMWPLARLGRLLSRSRRGPGVGPKGALLSTCLIFVLIFLFIPWQVAFLGCWIIHLYNCATSMPRPTASDSSAPIPLISQVQVPSADNNAIQSQLNTGSHRKSCSDIPLGRPDHYHRNRHILLLMSWLLPLVIPVLAVWVRTLMTAGYTVPFDGDHNFLNVTPFLLLVDSFSSNRTPKVNRESYRTHQAMRWSFFVLALISIFLGPRAVYRVFDAANVVVALIVFLTHTQIFGVSIPVLITIGSR